MNRDRDQRLMDINAAIGSIMHHADSYSRGQYQQEIEKYLKEWHDICLQRCMDHYDGEKNE